MECNVWNDVMVHARLILPLLMDEEPTQRPRDRPSNELRDVRPPDKRNNVKKIYKEIVPLIKMLTPAFTFPAETHFLGLLSNHKYEIKRIPT